MISKQTLYLTDDQKVVKEGDPKAKFLLVREGHEIADALLEKHDGAAEMANAAPKSKPKEEELPPGPTLKGDTEGPKPQNREADIKTRKRGKK